MSFSLRYLWDHLINFLICRRFFFRRGSFDKYYFWLLPKFSRIGFVVLFWPRLQSGVFTNLRKKSVGDSILFFFFGREIRQWTQRAFECCIWWRFFFNGDRRQLVWRASSHTPSRNFSGRPSVNVFFRGVEEAGASLRNKSRFFQIFLFLLLAKYLSDRPFTSINCRCSLIYTWCSLFGNFE